MSTCTYPHTIEDGAEERTTFGLRARDSDGDRLEVETLVKTRQRIPDARPQ